MTAPIPFAGPRRPSFPRRTPLACACVLAASVSLLATAAFAAPVIEITPDPFVFPLVSLGDTASVTLMIANRGDAPLVVDSISLPPNLGLSAPPPYTLAPDSVHRVKVDHAGNDTTAKTHSFTVHSNDPASPSRVVSYENRVLPLRVETLALTTSTSYPLGEAVVVQTAPLEGVVVERADLFHRSGTQTQFEQVRMTRSSRAFIAIIPGASVREGGVEYYVVCENSGFTATDPEQGAARPFRIDVQKPDRFDLDAVPRNPGGVWRVGESVDFLLTMQRGTVYRGGVLHYRRGGEVDYEATAILDISFTGIAASIPGDWVGPSGVEYWAELQTLTGTITLPRDTPETQPLSIRVSVDALTEGAARPAGRHRMVSIPLQFSAPTPLPSLLSDQPEFGPYDPMRWRSFRYAPELASNVEFSAAEAARFNVVPGRAFWLVSRQGHRVDTAPVPGLSPPTGGDFPIVLAPGWNQIGNPFPYKLPWRAVRRSPEIGEPVAYDPERGDYSDEAPSSFEPFEGYFIENTSAVAETLFVPPRDAGAGRVAPPALDAEPAPHWSLAIEARSALGVDLANRVGVAGGASIARDAWDASEPPPAPGAALRLAIRSEDAASLPRLHRRDFRPPSADGQVWEIDLAGAEATEAVELTLRPEGSLPEGFVVRIADREQGSVTAGVPAADGAFRHALLPFGGWRPYRLALVVGTEAFARGAVADAPPARLSLDPVAPNPARGAVRTRFGLPRSGPVRLDVFDVTGQRVATLVDGTILDPGFHTRVWRGTRDDGSRVASGVYFLRLIAGPETRSTRTTLIR